MASEVFYDSLWANTPVRATQHWQSWDIIKKYIRDGSPALELGPGTRPRFPIASATIFLELSSSGARALKTKGAQVVVGDLERPLPFPDSAFTAVGAFDVIEHIKKDDQLMSEIARVLVPGGYLICSVPLNMRYWTTFDNFVGHYRRYDPKNFMSEAKRHGLLPKAMYPTTGPIQFLATTFVAKIFAFFWIITAKHIQPLIYACERYLVAPFVHSRSILQGARKRFDPNNDVLPRRCPHAIFVFKKAADAAET